MPDGSIKKYSHDFGFEILSDVDDYAFVSIYPGKKSSFICL